VAGAPPSVAQGEDLTADALRRYAPGMNLVVVDVEADGQAASQPFVPAPS